jgi:Family of unknown function (DUF6152)
MRALPSKMFAAGFLLLAISVPLFGHHGTSRYDLAKTVTLNGTVTGFDWGNPHCLVHVDVKDPQGEVQHWTLELSSPYSMSRAGWSKDSLMLGDMLTAETHPAKNGLAVGISANSGSVMRFVVNGKPLSTQ